MFDGSYRQRDQEGGAIAECISMANERYLGKRSFRRSANEYSD
jgi:hypothetical protein